ncbi:hypothetical protein NA56DRAFT_463788 [Hyaloscypha hepaticicola]|jgi:hypothetical protein|uniref:Uncharacterized protein n=1 Tax=Hyaloscypha hepaticicola TaxID=2082293 RepID=A0A2J6QFB7_9HELO|nr:hypothetical protein NA56DRAFT_463788 [Hyaloscypha hepaticicola]
MTHSEASNYAVAQPRSSIPLRYYAFTFQGLVRKSSLVFQRPKCAFLNQIAGTIILSPLMFFLPEMLKT